MKNPTILVCGNDALLNTSRDLLLNCWGYRVLKADGAATLRAISQERVDLVIFCHTLSMKEYRVMAQLVDEFWPEARALTLDQSGLCKELLAAQDLWVGSE